MNPSDIYYSKGLYGVKRPVPSAIGYEGSGTVVDVEQSIKRSGLINSKVACWTNFAINSGTWAEFFVTDLDHCFQLDPRVDLIKYTNPWTNPITALGFLDLVQTGKHQAAVLTSAYSALGQMTIRLFKSHNIKTIAVIRNSAQEKELKELGATVVLNQNDEQFSEKFKAAGSELRASCFLDGLAGKVACNIFRLLP